MVEEAVISEETRHPLLACMQKPLIKDVKNMPSKVEVYDEHGKPFWVPVHKRDGVPIIKIMPPETASYCGLVLDVGIKNLDLSTATQEERLNSLEEQHKRISHATGSKLYLTLKEMGLEGVYTANECRNTSCEACRILNRKSTKVPQVKDVRKDSIAPGEIAYQDLVVDMPRGIGGFNHISVIVDAHSRRITTLPLRTKDEAITHCVEYVRQLEKERLKVKYWRSDNGGEFANEKYKKFLTGEGVAQEFRAPYTPQSQGVVERANGTIKRLLGKVLRSLQLQLIMSLKCLFC